MACKKCGNEHYNFQACPARQDKKPQVEWKTGKAWGDDLGELKTLGNNTFVQRREYDR
jgi:hypothetical protein